MLESNQSFTYTCSSQQTHSPNSHVTIFLLIVAENGAECGYAATTSRMQNGPSFIKARSAVIQNKSSERVRQGCIVQGVNCYANIASHTRGQKIKLQIYV